MNVNFKAQYPATIAPIQQTNPLLTAFNKVYGFIHKIIGQHVLVSQKNINNITPEVFARGFTKLQEIGGKPVTYQTADGVDINGMHFIGKDCTENSPTVILFNGTGLRFEEYGAQPFKSHRIFTIKNWLKNDVNVFVFNYRGTDKDPGCATRDGLVYDGDAAIQYVRDVLKVPEKKMIVHGHSLGAGVGSEVAALHPQVNYCNDRSFSSLSEQVKMMFGGGAIGNAIARILKACGWEYDSIGNWEKIKGHKWYIYHPKDNGIIKSHFSDAVTKKDSNATSIKMDTIWIKTKAGKLWPEDTSLLTNPKKNDLLLTHFSAHMRKLRSLEEKALYYKQIEIVRLRT